jgi:hypothetical protein
MTVKCDGCQKERTMTVEEMKKAGLLPEQKQARFKRQMEILKKHGQQNTEIYAALKRAIK